MQGNDSRFFVGAQVASVMSNQTSVIKHQSIVDAHQLSMRSSISTAGEEGDEDSWQPDSEDSDDTASALVSRMCRQP